ncbi:MAG TPA: integrase core domain-containing protein [Streptosporangiaceae bacterium]|nr:integrase core domain-containing protein [Streptosporangiaceae bacterium]
MFTAEGIRILASPPQAPRANAICDRIIGTLRPELLDRVLIINEHHLRRAPAEYLRHYNAARPHRFLGQLTRLRLTPGRLNRPTSPSSGSGGSRCSADSPVALWLSQLIVFALYPRFAARQHDRPLLTWVLTVAATAFAVYGPWATIQHSEA